ncbi:hypothetical protein JCM10213_008640 [Rhodosporidiobolus nylandii]
MQVDPSPTLSANGAGPFSPSLAQHPSGHSPALGSGSGIGEAGEREVQVQTEQAPLVTVRHSVTVPALHRLLSPHLSEQANLERFGRGGMALHGHEYSFEVVFRGVVCRKTGGVMGTHLLEDVISLAIVEVLSRKNLDIDISFFLSRPSTLENVALFAWRNVSVIMAPHPFDVVEVSVECEPCPRGSGSVHAGSRVGRTRVTFTGEMVSVPVDRP